MQKIYFILIILSFSSISDESKQLSKQQIQEQLTRYYNQIEENKRIISENMSEIRSYQNKTQVALENAIKMRDEFNKTLESKSYPPIIIKRVYHTWIKPKDLKGIQDYNIYYSELSMDNSKETIDFIKKNADNGIFVVESKTEKNQDKEIQHTSIMKIRFYKETFNQR